MSRYLKYVFPAADTQAVCLTQNKAAAGALILNGHLSNSINSEVPFMDHGYARQVSISSDNDLSARTFTVTGYQNDVLVTENITGPTAGATVYGNNAITYDKIISITVNGAANNVRAGTGYNGYFRLIGVNLLSPEGINCVLSTLNPETQISYTLYGSVNLLSQTRQTYSTLIANPDQYGVAEIENATTDGQRNSHFQFILAEVFVGLVGSVGTINDTATLIFRQT